MLDLFFYLKFEIHVDRLSNELSQDPIYKLEIQKSF